MPKLLTRPQAAERLGISCDTLDRLRAERKIAYIQHKPGGKVWFTEDAIAEYLIRATSPAQPPQPVVATYRRRRVSA